MKGLCENCCAKSASHTVWYDKNTPTPVCDDCKDAWEMMQEEIGE